MAIVNISVPISDTNKDAFEKFLKSLPTNQTPVAGDRLFKVCMQTLEQREKNQKNQAENRKILRLAQKDPAVQEALRKAAVANSTGK